MIVYVIVGLVVLAGLVLAYRTLGGASGGAIDAGALLLSALGDAHDAAAELSKLASAPPLAGAGGPSAPNPARLVRRRLTSLAQQLETVDVAPLDEHNAGAHALLAVAVDELVWAAAMCADDTFSTSDGMRTASAALRDHAIRCLHDAARILVRSAPGEEVERAP